MYFVAFKCANYHENNSCPNLVHLMAFVYAILHVKSCTWTWCNQMPSCMPFGMQRTPRQPYGARILTSTQSTSNGAFFFHEYGRRVGMVPRSSLKGGKNSLMVEKRTRTTNTTQNQTNQSTQAESPPSCSLSSVLGETGETKTSD